jgi:hypothetical protein
MDRIAGAADHTRDSHSARDERGERDVDTAKLKGKAGGTHAEAGDWGPSKGVRGQKARCGAGRAKGGGGMRLVRQEGSQRDQRSQRGNLKP